MSKHIQATRSQCDAHKAAIDLDAGCPLRGRTIGGPERVNPLVVGPGWTTTVVYEVLQVNPSTAVLEVPDDRLQHLGQSGVPEIEASVTDEELPANLRRLVYQRRGRDENGDPLPGPSGAAIVAGLRARGGGTAGAPPGAGMSGLRARSFGTVAEGAQAQAQAQVRRAER